MRRLLFLLASVAGALVLGVLAGLTPAPLGPNAPPASFSAGRAMVDIRRIAARPHVTGSAADAAVRAYLTARLQALGLAVETQAAPLSPRARKVLASWREPAGPEVAATNLIAVLPGRDPAQPAVLAMAHHDTVAGSPGASDDGAGVAALLETVRAIEAGPKPVRDLIIVFTDAEELNSDGARAFFHDDPLARRVGAVVNLEARGGGGRALMFEAGPDDGPMIGLFAHAVGQPSANSMAVLVYRLMRNATDFLIPERMGVPGFNFAFLGRAGLYHAAQQTPDAIDAGSVQHIGGQVVDVVRALVTAPALPAKGPDAVFSDLFGLHVLAYPAWGGWVVLAVAAGLLAVAAVRASRAGPLSPLGMVRGAAASLGVTLAAAGLLQAFNAVSGGGARANYFGRLAAIPRLETQALLVALAAAGLAAIGRRSDRALWSEWLGVSALGLAVALAIQVVAPGAGPLFAWPLVVSALAAALTEPTDIGACGSAAARIAVLGAIAGAWLVGLAHLAFLGVGFELPGAEAIFLMLSLLTIWPLLRSAGPWPARAAIPFLVVALGLALWVRLDAPAPTIPVYARAP